MRFPPRARSLELTLICDRQKDRHKDRKTERQKDRKTE